MIRDLKRYPHRKALTRTRRVERATKAAARVLWLAFY